MDFAYQFDREPPRDGVRRIPVRNASGEEVPAFAAMRITGFVAADGVFTVEKPTAASQTEGIVFNGPVKIAATADSDGGTDGVATAEFPLVALCYTSDAVPAVGDSWGTASGVWYLRKNNTGYTCKGLVLASGAGGHYAQFVQGAAAGGSRWVHFVLPSALAKTDASKASCTVENYWGGADPGATVTVWNMPAATSFAFSAPSGHKGYATYDEIDDKWRVVQLQC